MRKVDVLTEILKKISEQDDAVASIVSEPDTTPPSDADMDVPLPPPSYDDEFFKQLRKDDVIVDQDIPEITYKIISDPVIEPESGMVTSLQAEVESAPEGNAKGVVVGDQFDMVSAMPKMTEPGVETPPDDELPSEDEPSDDVSIEEPIEAKKDNKPAWSKKVGAHKAAPNQPGKKKKGEGYSLKRRFPGIKEAATTGIVQEIRADGKVAVRMGKWYKLFDSAAGVKVGDMVELDGDKITKVISSQDQPIFSKAKS